MDSLAYPFLYCVANIFDYTISVRAGYWCNFPERRIKYHYHF
jgi:hypothetical protein